MLRQYLKKNTVVKCKFILFRNTYLTTALKASWVAAAAKREKLSGTDSEMKLNTAQGASLAESEGILVTAHLKSCWNDDN